MPKIKRNCEICSAEFYKKPSEIKNRSCKYCSISCYKESKRTGQIQSCKICGKEFYINKKRIELDKGIFCSQECHYVSNRSGKLVDCLVCGKKSYVIVSRRKNSKNIFCSRVCYYVHIKTEFKCRPSWKGGVYKNTRDGRWYVRVLSGKYRPRSHVVMENYLGRGLDPHEVVHHINEDPSDDRIENLQVMSRSDHTCYHNYKRCLNS